MSTCRSCGAEVIWARTASGKRMPVDAAPVPDGNVTLVPSLLSGDLPYAVVGHDRDADGTRHNPHFATCEFADRHRRKR